MFLNIGLFLDYLLLHRTWTCDWKEFPLRSCCNTDLYSHKLLRYETAFEIRNDANGI